MKLKDIYELGLKLAMEADPRGTDRLAKILNNRQNDYKKLSDEEKKSYDPEDLRNPYSDSRILLGNLTQEVDSLMAGIDIEAAEVLLADRLNQTRKKSIDLLISHHPIAGSLAGLHEVMELQIDLLAKYGVPVNIADGMMKERISEVKRRFNPRNHAQALDAARLLNMSLMCVHTMTDNLVFDYLEKLFDAHKNDIDTVGDVMELLNNIYEYQVAAKAKAGPVIFHGNPLNRAGRVAPLEITGGTDASHIIYEKLAIAGVGTIVGMHASEEHRKECAKYHINLVIAGHMSSDSLGMNLFLDQIEKKGVEITACSGLIRHRRT